MPPWRGQTGWAGGRKRRWQTWGANESSDPQTAAERIQFQFQTREFIDSWVVTRDLYGGLVCVNTSEDNKTAWFVSYVNYRIHPSGFDPVGLCLLVCSALLLWFHQSRMRSHLTPAGGQPLICVLVLQSHSHSVNVCQPGKARWMPTAGFTGDSVQTANDAKNGNAMSQNKNVSSMLFYIENLLSVISSAFM